MKLSDYFVQSSIFKFLLLLLFKYNHKRKTNANKPEGTRKENRFNENKPEENRKVVRKHDL